MLRAYHHDSVKLVQIAAPETAADQSLVWLDLLNPTLAEEAQVEQLLGLVIPTKAEMEEIELSARLYNEDGAEFMTMTALTGLDTEDPSKTAITFILKANTLITVRYADPKPFLAFLTRAKKPKSVPCSTGGQIFMGLLEAIIDRSADALERVGNEIDQISREVFRKKSTTAQQMQQNLQSIIEQIGAKAELLTMVQESLVSISRLVAFHGAPDDGMGKVSHDTRQSVKLIQRDALSLGEHARALSNKLNFLLDATLGLINLEQNQIIKIFSVAAVVLLPPTLIGSIYGMNFNIMPELEWDFGYPFSLGLMVLSSVLPFWYFKRRGWL